MTTIQIRHKPKIITKKLIIIASILSFLAGVFFYLALPVSAAPVLDFTKSPNEICNFKIKKNNCITTVTGCRGNLTCMMDAMKFQASFGGNINQICQIQQTPFAQDCHKAIVKECAGKTGDALLICKRTTKARVLAAATAGTPTAGSPTDPSIDKFFNTKGAEKQYTCGKGEDEVKVRFNFGCLASSKDPEVVARAPENPIVDMAFALIKFLTIGVGLVIAISIIFAGIMYTTSGGNPEQTSKAKDRIMNAMIGLIFYLLISAFANFLIPGGLF